MNKKHEISREMQQGHADILHMTLAFPSAEWPGLWNQVSSMVRQSEEKA
jgi:hypothetical protein